MVITVILVSLFLFLGVFLLASAAGRAVALLGWSETVVVVGGVIVFLTAAFGCQYAFGEGGILVFMIVGALPLAMIWARAMDTYCDERFSQ